MHEISSHLLYYSHYNMIERIRYKCKRLDDHAIEYYQLNNKCKFVNLFKSYNT